MKKKNLSHILNLMWQAVLLSEDPVKRARQPRRNW